MVDEKRRVVMPSGCPPHSAVTIQQIDRDTWVIRRQVTDTTMKMIAIPVIQKLPDDPEWEKVEAQIARSTSRNLPCFEE